MEKEELKELQQEEERLRSQLDNIAFVNHIENKELDEFWTAITQLIDNQIELEKYCNN